MHRTSVGIVIAVSALLAAPALAQNTARSLTTSITQGKPLASPLTQTQGGWRGTQIIGATVYNEDNQSIGTIDDLLVGNDGRVTAAVLSVGGFLGIGSKLIKVPYEKLRFEPDDLRTSSHILLPGTTKNALHAMPSFDYTS
jgi:hypothetical protein